MAPVSWLITYSSHANRRALISARCTTRRVQELPCCRKSAATTIHRSIARAQSRVDGPSGCFSARRFTTRGQAHSAESATRLLFLLGDGVCTDRRPLRGRVSAGWPGASRGSCWRTDRPSRRVSCLGSSRWPSRRSTNRAFCRASPSAVVFLVFHARRLRLGVELKLWHTCPSETPTHAHRGRHER